MCRAASAEADHDENGERRSVDAGGFVAGGGNSSPVLHMCCVLLCFGVLSVFARHILLSEVKVAVNCARVPCKINDCDALQAAQRKSMIAMHCRQHSIRE